MSLQLQIFAPFDLGRTYCTPTARAALEQQLRAQGWQPTDFRTLDLDLDYHAQHASFHRDVSKSVHTDQRVPPLLVRGVTGLERIEVWVQSTGLCLIACTYHLDLQTDPAHVEVESAVRNAYHLLCKPDGSHFQGVFAVVAKQLGQLLGTLPTGQAEVLTRPAAEPNRPPHWTHGIYRHVVGDARQLMSLTNLQVLAGNSLECHSYKGVVVNVPGPTGTSDTGRGPAHQVADMEGRACFGWETTAVSTTDEEEAENIALLVKLLGYIWEIHYVVHLLAARKIQRLQEEAHSTTLDKVRQFRQQTASLLSVCHEVHLTMTDRFVHMIRSMIGKWHLHELKGSIQTNSELLDLVSKHLEDVRGEDRNRRINLFLATLALLSVISVTTDVVNFVSQYGQKTWPGWEAMFAQANWGSDLPLLLGPAMLTLIAGLWILLRKTPA